MKANKSLYNLYYHNKVLIHQKNLSDSVLSKKVVIINKVNFFQYTSPKKILTLTYLDSPATHSFSALFISNFSGGLLCKFALVN